MPEPYSREAILELYAELDTKLKEKEQFLLEVMKNDDHPFLINLAESEVALAQRVRNVYRREYQQYLN